MAEHSAENDALDLDAITEKWLQQCGPCDAGLAMGCSHPDEDYRPVMSALVTEVERLRTRVTPPVDMCHNGHPFVPGVSIDTPDEPDPRWCNTCGETRVIPPTEEAP